MSRTKGSANFSGSLEVLAGAPVDARSIVATKAELTASGNFPYKYIGMKVVVQSECKEYMLTGADTTNLNNWHEMGSGADNVKEGYLNQVDGKFYEESTYETEIVGSQGYLYVTLDTNNIYRFDGSDFVNLTGIDVTIYQPGGSYFFANLPANNASHLGMVYDVKDDFTTTSDFIEGAGIDYPAGTNVVVINNGTSALPEYKYDVLAGNMSNYQKKVQFVSFPTASVDYLNMVYQYTGDDDIYKCGAYYRCEAQDTDPVTYKWERKPADTMFGTKASAEDVAAAKAAFQPVSYANIRLWEIYDEDGVEIEVGEVRKTIDGVKKKKPLYKKVVDFGALPSNTIKNVQHGIDDVEDFVRIQCMMVHTNGYSTELIVSTSTVSNQTAVGADKSKCYIDTKSTSLTVYSAKFTLRYTKTTDEWQPI